MSRWVLLALISASGACSGGAAPEIHGLVDQVATVGGELMIELDGTDADGDQLTYGVHTDVSLQGSAMLTKAPSGVGVFRWTPLAKDLGAHAFDFTASDGSNTTTVSISIEVRSAVGAVPIFRQPLGTGSVVNLAADPCAKFDILVEDQDTAAVTIAQEPPLVDGAMLDVIDGTSAKWTWCPTPEQIAASDRYTAILSADDGENPKTVKDFILVLRNTGPAKLVINEVDYDMVGTDTAEFVEILNTSPTTANLAGLQLVLVNGANGMPYDTVDLSPIGTLAGGAYLTIAGPNVTPAGGMKLDPVWTQDQLQNGAPDGLALIDSVTHTVLDALSYEGSVATATLPDFPAPVSLVEGNPIPAATADSNTATRSLCRNPDGADTNDAATDWAICTTLTPGAANQP